MLPALATLPLALDTTDFALLALLAAVGAGLIVGHWLRLNRRREAELRTLAALGQAVAAAADSATEVAEAAYIQTAHLLPADFFQLGIFQGEAYRTLIWVRDGNRLHNREFTLEDGQEGLVGWIRRTGEPLLVPDFRRTERLPAAPSYTSDDPPASGLFVPLQVENTVIGILAVQSRKANAFRRRELLLLQALAGSISTTLAAISWRGQIVAQERQIALLEDIAQLLTPLRPLSDVLPMVANQIASRLEASVATVFELIEDRLVPLAGAGRAETASLSEGSEVAAFLQDAVSAKRLRTRARGPDATGPSPHPVWECACPLRVQDRVLGVLYLSRRTEPFLAADRRLVELVASQLALAFLEAANYAQQQEEAWFTTVLLEIARHASQPGDVTVALLAVLQLTTLLAGASWTVLLTAEPGRPELSIGPSAGLKRPSLDRLVDLAFDPSEFGLAPPYGDESPRSLALPASLAAATGSVEAMASILTDGERLLGLLLVQAENVEGRRQSLLAGIAHQISLRLENSALVEDATQRRSLERELRTARTIQESFLPDGPPEHRGWQVGAYWRAARSVGGDFYDYIPLPPGPYGPRWGLAIADVSDKGVPAALYMALTRTLLRSVAPAYLRPGATLARLNHLLLNETRSEMFVSAWYGIWDPGRGRLVCANAGHNPPLIFRPGLEASRLPTGQTILGVLPDIEYLETTIDLVPGTLLLMYTDGVSEAWSDEGDLFGVERIEHTVLGMSTWEPEAVLATLGDRIAEFSGRRDPADDLTIVCLHRRPEPETP